MTLLCLAAGSLCAQEKVYTMEEAIVGYHLYPQRHFIQWQGDKDAVVEFKEGSLKARTIGKKGGAEEVVVRREDFSKITGMEVTNMPHVQWLDGKRIRFSYKGYVYTGDIETKTLIQKIKLPANAENIEMHEKGCIAFTRDNNLYLQNDRGEETALTTDRDKNIVNGQVVSRNEFGIEKGIFWSPDGNKIAFYRKDNTHVTDYPLLDITTRTGSVNMIKYPMTGMDSERISLGIYSLTTGKTVFAEVTDFDEERYLTNISWSPDAGEIYIQVLNRRQNHMKLNVYDAENGSYLRTILEEKSNKYVEPSAPLVFIEKDSGKFLYRTNNRDGYWNLYLCDVKGKSVKRLTKDAGDVTYVGQDANYVYYMSAAVSPIENHLFRVSLKGGKSVRLTREPGWHHVVLSGSRRYFIDNYSSTEIPRRIDVASTDGKYCETVFTAPVPNEGYKLGELTLGTIKAADGKTDLYYRLLKPADFDPSRKYPVIVYVYGGPHAQMVQNVWGGGMPNWEMLMAQKGYAVFVLDNRGSWNRGKEFEAAIYGQCGKAEMADQIEGVKFLKSHAWVDASRIGVHGWSYGGFMTISLMTNYPEVFKVGVAGGPVIDWKWYEVMYGERYMGNPKDNPAGYAATSLIPMAAKLKGKLLICQGVIDNVVVPEHSLSFVRACIQNNVQVDYFPYPRAEHNVTGRDRIHLMQKVTDYFEDFLK